MQEIYDTIEHFSATGEYTTVTYAKHQLELTGEDDNLVLYSTVKVKSPIIDMECTLPTVNIPYKHDSFGFRLDGSNKERVAIYNRAPGASLDITPKGKNLIIVPDTQSSSYMRIIPRNTGLFLEPNTKVKIPLGIFLKAAFGLPYRVLAKGFTPCPFELLYSFPSSIPSTRDKLNKLYNNFQTEPTYRECVDYIYTLYYPTASKESSDSEFPGRCRFMSRLLQSISYKVPSVTEEKLSIWSRALHMVLDKDIKVDTFEGVPPLHITAGTTLTADLIYKLSKYDVTEIHANGVILKEERPMVFRALGYRLAQDAAGYSQGELITQEVLDKLNSSECSLPAIDVVTPDAAKTLARSSRAIELTDFYNLLNFYYTCSADHGSYSVDNRVIITYKQQVYSTVKSVYESIVQDVDNLLSSREDVSASDIMEVLPLHADNTLKAILLDNSRKETSETEVLNPLAHASVVRKASALMESAPKEMSKIQVGQFCRLDALHVPDSDKIGSVHQITTTTVISPDGEIQTPYLNTRTNQIEYVGASKEKGLNIAPWDADITQPELFVRCDGDIVLVPNSQVHYQEVSPFSDMSLSRSLLPLPEFTAPKRLAMASKHQTQAVPLIRGEAPIIGTGMQHEVPGMYFTYEDILASKNITPIPNARIHISHLDSRGGFNHYYFHYPEDNPTTYKYSVPNGPTKSHTLNMFRLKHKPNNLYSAGDIVFQHICVDDKKYSQQDYLCEGIMPLIKHKDKPALAIGKNLYVGYKTFKSSTIDDALVISDALVANKSLSSLQMFDCSLKLEEGYIVSRVVPLHSWVDEGDPVISYYIGDDTSKERTINAPHSGEVILTYTDHFKASVHIMSYHDAELGDKLSGRDGNKSVIAKIVPSFLMPYDPDTGRSLDIILSPLGIPSRQNGAQIYKAFLSNVFTRLGVHSDITPYFPNLREIIMDMYAEHPETHPKKLYLPEFNKFTEKPIFTGYMYMLKLEHMSGLKVAALGSPTHQDPITGQPIGSRNESKGQKIGEYETWALAACNMHKTIDDFYTLYSQDHTLLQEYYGVLAAEDGAWSEVKEDLKQQARESGGHICYSAILMRDLLRAFGVDLTVQEGKYSILPFKTEDLPLAEAGALPNTKQWTAIQLPHPTIHPFWVQKCGKLLSLMFGIPSRKKLLQGDLFLDTNTRQWFEGDHPDGALTSIPALIWLLENTTLTNVITKTDVDIDIDDDDNDNEEVALDLSSSSVSGFINNLKQHGLDLSSLVMRYLPVLPGQYRRDERGTTHPYTRQYINIANSSSSTDIYNKLCRFVGYPPINKSATRAKDSFTPLLTYFLGKGSRNSHGMIREKVFSTRVAMSFRSVIIPATDLQMSPFHIGVPWYTALRVWDKILQIYLKTKVAEISNSVPNCPNLSEGFPLSLIYSLYEFNPKTLGLQYPESSRETLYALYIALRKTIQNFLEGTTNSRGELLINGTWIRLDEYPGELPIATVLCGRQPTLHERSIRGFFVKLVDGWCIRIHPTVCASFNADFDGDTMHGEALLGESKKEAVQNMFADSNLVNAKDRKLAMELQQDIILGLYCLTTFKDNALEPHSKSDYYYYSNLETLSNDVIYGSLKCYDLVLYKHSENRYYLSTAGRILFNSKLANGFTSNTFKNPNNLDCLDIPLYDLAYDTAISSTKNPKMANISKILEEVYASSGARETVCTIQSLYELGLMISDIYGISLSVEDLQSPIDLSGELQGDPQMTHLISKLQSLGIISNQAAVSERGVLYNEAHSKAQHKLLTTLPRSSNFFYMMDSGARGKADQLMQSIGAVGFLKKSKASDITEPIRHSYSDGLNSLEYQQTYYSARSGVVATQAETKDTGYLTRQTVNMLVGLHIVEDDCHISTSIMDVPEDMTELLSMYSYALPFCKEDGQITEKTLEFIKEHKMTEIIASPYPFDMETLKEAFVPVDYISDSPLFYDETVSDYIDELNLYKWKVVNPPRYYNQLLKDEHLTSTAVKVILTRQLKSVCLEDNEGVQHEIIIRYKLSSTFKDFLLDRIAYGLPYLDAAHRITPETLQVIEKVQLSYIPARTTLTCKSEHGVCAHCFGYEPTSTHLPKVGTEIGIIASTAMCEVISQATLNTSNAGGKRASGQVNGLEHYTRLLKGSTVTKDEEYLLEVFATKQGYISEDGSFYQQTIPIESLAYPPKAWVEEGDLLKIGYTDLSHYASSNIFYSAIRLRWVLIKEYAKIFNSASLYVSARNYEILARAQTTNIYDNFNGSIKDAVTQIYTPNSEYTMRVSTRDDTVRTFNGVGSLGFENEGSMIAAALINPEILQLNSLMSRFFVGAPSTATSPTFYVPTTQRVSHKESTLQAYAGTAKSFFSFFGGVEPATIQASAIAPSITEPVVLEVASKSTQLKTMQFE